MVRALIYFLMEIFIPGNLNMESLLDMANIFGVINRCIQAIFMMA